MSRNPVYGRRDTKVRFWVNNVFFYSMVPWRAVFMALRSRDADDFTARCYLANIATHHRNNPRGKGREVTPHELRIEIIEEPSSITNPAILLSPDPDSGDNEEEPAQEYKQLAFF